MFCSYGCTQEKIFDRILNGLEPENFEIVKISLICPPDILKQKLSKDIAKGIRKAGVIEKSIAYLPLYEHMNTLKIETGSQTVPETSRKILQAVRSR